MDNKENMDNNENIVEEKNKDIEKKGFKKFISEHKKQTIIGVTGALILLIVGVVLAMNSMNGKSDETTVKTAESTTVQPTTAEQTTVEPTTEVNHDNDTISKLTGDWIPKKLGKQRPIAIMINNIGDAIPQAGISKASIIHECPVEGGMTRLMALFEDTKDIKRIGSIRSCRIYYCYISNEYDAIYTHFGQSKYAKDYLNTDAIDNISGLSAVGNTTFYRASDKYSPHDLYTDHGSGCRTDRRHDYQQISRS